RALASPRIVCGSRICPLRASVPAAAPARSRWVMPCGRLASRDRQLWAVTAPPPSRRRSQPRWQRTRRRSKHATAASGDEPGAAVSLPLSCAPCEYMLADRSATREDERGGVEPLIVMGEPDVNPSAELALASRSSHQEFEQ